MKFILSVSFLFVPMLLLAQQKEFNWLIGTWQEENLPTGQAGKKLFEEWKEADGFLAGSGYKLDAGGNKIINEEIKLVKRGRDFYYVPDVAGPQGAIEFKINSITKNSFTAENPTHDFPKKIIYKLTSENHLEATVSSETKSISYSFLKIK